ncbi:EAL domain-containing protein [Pseudomonas sp. MDT1-17]
MKCNAPAATPPIRARRAFFSLIPLARMTRSQQKFKALAMRLRLLTANSVALLAQYSALSKFAPLIKAVATPPHPIHRTFSISPLGWFTRKIVVSYYKYLSTTISDFLNALDRNEITVHYQPIVDMQSGGWLGAEALLRWPAKGSTFSPEAIVAELERVGLIQDVTRWVCRRVIEEYSQTLWACDELYITINLSAADVMDPTFPDFIQHLLDTHKLPASRFAFEVTERVALDRERAVVQLNRLRARGHRIVLDDFGTGYSSLAYLDQLQVDMIKFDKSFTLRSESFTSNIILSHLLQMAKKLDIDVVVEGIETTHQAGRVSALGAEKAQGWLYSKELSAQALVRAYFSLPHPSMQGVV